MSGRHRRQRLPGHLQDQLVAAERDTAVSLALAAARLGRPIEYESDDDDPTLLVLLHRMSDAEDRGEVGRCPHVRGFMPVIVQAWDQPWIFRCVACQNAVPRISDPVVDNTCDVCGSYDPTGIWPSQCAKGMVTILMGRCDECVPPWVRERGPR